MLTWIAAAALAQAPPGVRVEWKREVGVLRVTPPAGFHVGDDAPGTLDLRSGPAALHFELDGAVLRLGVPVGDLRGATLEGELVVPLCDDAGTSCQPTEWVLRGTLPTARRGGAALTVSAPETAAGAFGPEATDAPAEAALARAAETHRPVLLDFSAVWCPPCNQLALEVLHADPRPTELDAFEVAVVDADHPATHALKRRYAVGGYPTVIVTDEHGQERTRMVGYPGREAFLAWLASAPESTEAGDLARDPAELEPARAAVLAGSAAARGDEDLAERPLARASEGPDSLDLRLARVALAPAAADVEWLLAHAPDRAMAFLGAAGPLEEEDPELAARVVLAAQRVARGHGVADALAKAAELADDEATARLFYAGAVGALRSELTGDPHADKPWLTTLAELHEASGDPDGAVRVLEEASATFAEEPTYDLALAPLLARQGRLDEALEVAERAIARSWGDNRLRAVAAKADVLVKLGRADEAKAIAAAELSAQPPPDDGNARTKKYRARLQKFVDGS